MKYIKIIFLSLLFTYITMAQYQADIKTNINKYTKGIFKKYTNSIYKANRYNPLWTGENHTQRFEELLDALGNPLFNYKFKNFNQDEILDLYININNGVYSQNELPRKISKLDILATQSYLKLIYFIRVGDVDWSLVKQKLKNLKRTQDIKASWEIHPKSMPSVNGISSSINQDKITSYLKSILPLQEQYTSLVSMLNRYSAMPNLPKIPYGGILKPRRADSRIRQIKKHLQAIGDFPKNESTGTGYTSSLGRAIEKFKKRFNLKTGNYIDNKVIKYINTSKKEYIKRIITNLDMLKLQPHRLTPNRIEVNIPEFKLRYYSNDQNIFESDIIVGRLDRPTPVFNDKMEYIVLNPTWNIPDNLVRRDLMHVLKTNPNYLEENDIVAYRSGKKVSIDPNKLFKYEHNKKAIPYRFVQLPSDNNALGRVKFIFPNKYAVYLHDTDNRSLFKYRYKVFSSGCMRVAKPFDFMYEVLNNSGTKYSPSRLEDIFQSNKTTTIKLKKSIPVYTLYQSVKHIDGDDYFFYDVYMYEQIVYESTDGHRKSSFRVPNKRLTKINRIGSRIR